MQRGALCAWLRMVKQWQQSHAWQPALAWQAAVALHMVWLLLLLLLLLLLIFSSMCHPLEASARGAAFRRSVFSLVMAIKAEIWVLLLRRRRRQQTLAPLDEASRNTQHGRLNLGLNRGRSAAAAGVGGCCMLLCALWPKLRNQLTGICGFPGWLLHVSDNVTELLCSMCSVRDGGKAVVLKQCPRHYYQIPLRLWWGGTSACCYCQVQFWVRR
ncbi:hypothetical protein COO60DRAFT_603646 [Scenedesmus sp. NREL 46B-D3]|nr:hypothetical protein COO60DRAFT_603646 [Scenedesmus sp. NREL 46B-D3]